MKRIGIAASKISKGNLALYNFCVVLISVLFSLSIFVVAGSTVIFAYLLAITVFLLDFIYAIVDPRVKIGGQGGAQ